MVQGERRGTSPHRSTCLAGTVSAASGLMQGCRGRSPRRNKLWGSPFPPGRGAGGWGQESKLKAGIAGEKKRQVPRWASEWQGKPVPHPPAPLPPCPPQKNHPPWLTCTETQPRIVHPEQPAERKAKKIRKLFGKPVDKPRKECYNGNATGTRQCATCR